MVVSVRLYYGSIDTFNAVHSFHYGFTMVLRWIYNGLMMVLQWHCYMKKIKKLIPLYTTANVLQRYDHQLLRYMAGVRWQDEKSSIEVRDKCGVEDLSVKMMQRRLKYFGHVRKVEDSF